MARGKDLVGCRFGRLTVLEKTDQREKHYVLWRCRCDCGREILVDTKRLKRGTVRDCGCVPGKNARRGNVAEDLTGQKFGELTVISRAENKNGRVCWLCSCSCGGQKITTAHDLKAGKCRSCGGAAHRTGRNKIDLTGRHFGRLTALYPTDARDRRGSVYWHCSCECGNTVDLPESVLVYGNYRSCGCMKRENQKQISKKLHMIDGTCIEMLEKRKYREDNTSGFRGVYQMKNHKYRVSIGFKRQRFYVGVYDNYDDAVQARLSAEELVHDGFVHAYRAWKEKADRDPEWAEDHPLHFEVKKVNGSLQVMTG